MQRRQFNHWMWAGVLGAGYSATPVWAQEKKLLSASDALGGIRAALSTGAKVAVEQLGKPDGFMLNPKVRIPLPSVLENAAPLLKAAGQGKRLDELVLAMNQAAELAVPLAAKLLQQAIANLSVTDAQHILTGGETSVTDFFAGTTREPLTAQFLPVVRQTTDQVQLAGKYESVAGRAVKLGVMKKEEADLPGFVTSRALDGLYAVIADEERKIRQNPAQAGSALLKKVFGSL